MFPPIKLLTPTDVDSHDNQVSLDTSFNYSSILITDNELAILSSVILFCPSSHPVGQYSRERIFARFPPPPLLF